MKLEEIREKSVKELNDMVVDYKKQLFDLRFKRSTNKYENATDLGRANRKTIARVKTVIKQKESV